MNGNSTNKSSSLLMSYLQTSAKTVPCATRSLQKETGGREAFRCWPRCHVFPRPPHPSLGNENVSCLRLLPCTRHRSGSLEISTYTRCTLNLLLGACLNFTGIPRTTCIDSLVSDAQYIATVEIYWSSCQLNYSNWLMVDNYIFTLGNKGLKKTRGIRRAAS